MSFVIECTDTNLEYFSPVLTVEVYENSRFVRKTITGNVISITNGQRVEFRNLNEDGVYSLTCHAQDKAGNSYETVNIIDAGGKQVTETAGQGGKLLDFSINKGGSIFSLDDNTMKLVKDYYVQKVYHDVVVREINPDEVTSCTVKVNGKALKQGTDFSVNNVSESDGWHKYEYVISNAVFEKEGQYNIVVETKDKADSVAYSDVKSVNIEFIVDKTAPTYTLTGVDKNNENYIGSKNAVLMPKDDGGKLGRVKITVVGSDDKEKKVIKEMSGDDMLDYLDKHDGKIEFEVPKEVLSAKDGDSRLMVECADCSVDEGGKTNKVKKIYGKDTEADTEIAEDDVPMESNSSDVKSVETNNDKSVDEALLDVDEKVKSEKQLCQIEDNGIVHVYMQGYNNVKFEDVDINRTNTYIKCYDFVTVSDGYNYSGERKLVINFDDDKKYTWKETFLADLFMSRDAVYRGAVEKKYKVLPAWGVTDYSDISNVTVDDQKIDEVHELDVDGKTYYLWIINDLKTQNEASEVRIESVDKTTQNR